MQPEERTATYKGIATYILTANYSLATTEVNGVLFLMYWDTITINLNFLAQQTNHLKAKIYMFKQMK